MEQQETNNSEINKKQKDIIKEIKDFIKDIIIILVIVFFIRTFLVLPFQISWQSMYSSYYDREFIIVDRLSYLNFFWLWSINWPKRWDVVVFNTHIKWKEYFIKRIIWLPWDTIKIKWWSVYLKASWESDFKELDERYLNENNYKKTLVWWLDSEFVFNVPIWEYFVMWDNRNWSSDSRTCFWSCELEWWNSHYVKYDDIVWKIFIDLWYFNFRTFSFSNKELWIDTKPRFLSSPSTYEYK